MGGHTPAGPVSGELRYLFTGRPEERTRIVQQNAGEAHVLASHRDAREAVSERLGELKLLVRGDVFAAGASAQLGNENRIGEPLQQGGNFAQHRDFLARRRLKQPRVHHAQSGVPLASRDGSPHELIVEQSGRRSIDQLVQERNQPRKRLFGVPRPSLRRPDDERGEVTHRASRPVEQRPGKP